MGEEHRTTSSETGTVEAVKHTLFPTGFEQRGRDGKVASSTDTGRSTHYTLYNMLPQDLSRGRGMGEVAFSCHTEGEGRERKGRGAKQIYSMKKALLHVSFLRS